MTEEFIEIHWTSGSLEEAQEVARKLVKSRDVACAQITPAIESVYIWEDHLETAHESKVVFKTHESKFDAVKEVIQKECSYDVPEITKVAISGGNKEYLDWIRKTITKS